MPRREQATTQLARNCFPNEKAPCGALGLVVAAFFDDRLTARPVVVLFDESQNGLIRSDGTAANRLDDLAIGRVVGSSKPRDHFMRTVSRLFR